MNSRTHPYRPILLATFGLCSVTLCRAEDYAIVDTGQERCYENYREIEYPRKGEAFFGQDAQYLGHQPAYRDNGNGTITDLVTGLMWQQDPGPKQTFAQAVAGAASCRVGGYEDWRLPGIKELYSLILFSGEDIDPQASSADQAKPFIDTTIFHYRYGDPAKGERIIDSQAATATRYVSTTMRGSETMFGVNFADGRIKGYPIASDRPGRPVKQYLVFYVRGNANYGKNDFQDNGDGTITDRATGLIWTKVDSGHLKAGDRGDGCLNWEQALRWVAQLDYAGHTDWRLPNAKEMQSIVDYTRSPDTTDSAAIDPLFDVTPVRDPAGKVNYPFYWTSTTHKRMGGGESAVYIAFGRSQGWMRDFQGQYELLDVHGAGSQRSDPKTGDPAQFPRGRGPQGDVVSIFNMVRPVRAGAAEFRTNGPDLEPPRPKLPPPRPKFPPPAQRAAGTGQVKAGMNTVSRHRTIVVCDQRRRFANSTIRRGQCDMHAMRIDCDRRLCFVLVLPLVFSLGTWLMAQSPEVQKQPPQRPKQPGESPFDIWDRNRDGYVTRDEFPARLPAMMFDRVDSDKDGKLSRAEDDAFRAQNRAKNQGKADAVASQRPEQVPDGTEGGRIPEGTRVLRDVVYETVGDRRLPLDLYVPTEPQGPLPLVIWIHGGGWRTGSKNNPGPALRLLRRGYAVASVEYRLSGEAQFPAAIEDCKAAVSFLRLHAQEYRLNPERFGVWGGSAGGHLVALLGTTNDADLFNTHGVTAKASPAVQAVCDWYGPTDFLQMDAHAVSGSRLVHDSPDSPESLFVGGPIQQEPHRAVVVRANPITYVSQGDPPMLLVHGDNDVLVPHHQSQLLHEALRKAGVESTLQIVKGAGHGLRGGEKTQDELVDMAAAFFDRYLKG